MTADIPRVFQELPANDVPVQTLVSMLASTRVAHAVLCVGPPSSQSDLVAQALACALVCQHNGCTTCDSCLQARRHMHPDIHEYWPGGTNGYLIDQAQEIISDAAVMPLCAPYKVYVLHDADKLTASSANALLKTLEEAPSRVVFILTTSKRFNVLETIVSRCVVCNFAALPSADVCTYLEHYAKTSNATSRASSANTQNDGTAAHMQRVTMTNSPNAVASSTQRSIVENAHHVDLTNTQLIQSYLASCGGSIVQCKQLMASALLQQLRLACFEACLTLLQADEWQALCCAQSLCDIIEQCVQEEQQHALHHLEETREFLSNKAVQKLELTLKRENVIYNLSRYLFCIDVLEALITNVLECMFATSHAVTLHDQRALIERLASCISEKQGVHMLECLQTYRYRLTRNCIPSVCLKALFIELREDLYGSCSPC